MDKKLTKLVDDIVDKAQVKYTVDGDICKVMLGKRGIMKHEQPLKPGERFVLVVPVVMEGGVKLGEVEIGYYWNGVTLKKEGYKLV